MASTSAAPETTIAADVWFKLKMRELEGLDKALEADRKAAGRREFALVVTCLLALLYVYPVYNLTSNPDINITAVSLKIPLKEAITVFPTLIATVYLVFISLAVGQMNIAKQRVKIIGQIEQFTKGGGTADQDNPDIGPLFFNFRRRLLLPSALHVRGTQVVITAVFAKAIVDGFVGLVFVLLPFITAGFVSAKAWKLIGNRVVLGWDSLCLLVMLCAFVSSFISATAPSIHMPSRFRRLMRSGNQSEGYPH